MFERFFKLQQHSTDVKTEFVSGMITFFAMSYILIVNPAILSAAGVPLDRVFTATVIAILIGTLIMALGANYPIVIAPGMGLNSYFVTIAATTGNNYQTLLATCFLAGLIFVALSLTKFRESLINAIPSNLKHGISAAIGLFIAFIGLKNSKLIVANEHTILSLGNLKDPGVYMTVFGIVVILILLALEVRGAIFFGMIITAVACYFHGLLKIDGFFGIPKMELSFLYNPVSESINVLQAGLAGIVFTFLMVTLFDTTGTTIAVTEQANLMKDGKIERAREAFLADSTATLVGALFGTSPTSAYIESSSGVANGGRTGLTALSTCLFVALSIFLFPLATSLASVSAITAPALIIIGSFMMESIAKIDWSDITEAFPAFVTIIGIPLTGSINDGIAFGFIFYVVLKFSKKQWKDIHPLMYLFALLFVIQLIWLHA